MRHIRLVMTVLLLVSPSIVMAEIVTIQIEGVITSGEDRLDYVGFGTDDGDLNGQSISISLTYDTELSPPGELRSSPPPPETTFEQVNDPFWMTLPIVTIGGVSVESPAPLDADPSLYDVDQQMAITPDINRIQIARDLDYEVDNGFPDIFFSDFGVDVELFFSGLAAPEIPESLPGNTFLRGTGNFFIDQNIGPDLTHGVFVDFDVSAASFNGVTGDDAAVYGGVSFPAGAASFADRVIRYDPKYGGGPAPDETQQDARQILGVPGQGEMSLGRGGRLRVQFLDNSLSGSDDSQPDLYIFEVGGDETTHVDISKDGRRWFSVGMATGFAFGIDIDEYGFDSADRFSYVRITDDGDSNGDFYLTAGADLVAVGARSSAPPAKKQPPITFYIQAHIGGRSELIMQGNKLQWHHIKGTAPGLERAFWNYGSNSNSPTIIDSNQGPNIPWVPSGWPGVLGNGTHPESMSSVFDALTPVFPQNGRCWKLEKMSGSGKVKIVQQPNAENGYTMVIEFDDLILGKMGGMYHLPGSGFYTVKLSSTFKRC